MNAFGKICAFTGVLLLGPTLAMSDNLESVASNMQTGGIQVPQEMPVGMMPAMPMWPQPMMAAPGMMPYGGMPPGMMWPMPVPATAEQARTEASQTVSSDASGAAKQSPHLLPQGMMPAMPMWPQQMMAAPGLMPYGGMPPAMMWPMPSPYPAPMVMPSSPQIIWVPFMRVLVPAQGGAATVPGVSYGPVADTPVVASPRAEPVIEPVAPAKSVPAIPVEIPAPPAEIKSPAPAVKSAVGPALPVAQDAPLSEAITTEPVTPPVQAPVKRVAVDYGPIAPAPVVYLDEQLEQTPPPPHRKRARSVQKPTTQAAPAPALKAGAKTAAQPVKQRMCWTQGVVAPCR